MATAGFQGDSNDINITPGEFRLTYVWQKPDDRDAHVEIKTITAPSHADAREQARQIYESHPEGTLLDNLMLVEVREILYTEAIWK